MATYYITSADVGAPALTGQNGSGVAVVTYIAGIAGLSVAYTGTNRCIIIMPNGDPIRFHHDSAASGDARLMIVRAAESATGIDTLVDPFPLVSQVPDSQCNWLMSSTASAVARSWWALVDTTHGFFWFVVDIINTAGTVAGFVGGGGMYFGGQSLLAADSYCSFITTKLDATNNASGAAFNWAGLPNQSAKLFWKRTRDGTIKSPRGFVGPYGNATTLSVTSGPFYPDPDDGKYRRERMFVGDTYSQGTFAGISPEVKRAWVPHMWFPQHAINGYSGINVGDTFTDGAYDMQIGASATFCHFPLNSAAGAVGAMCVEVTDTWSAPSLI